MCIECGRDKPSLKVIVGDSVRECCGNLGWVASKEMLKKM